MTTLSQMLRGAEGCLASAGTELRIAAGRVRRDQRGSVAILTASVTPVLLMVAGLAIEVSHWTAVKLELQRTADLAALAGATDYALVSNARNAADAAANLAELNGAVGSTARTWDAARKLLGNNLVSAQVAAGVRDPQSTALKVTVSRPVPLVITQMMSAAPSIAISATGWAELRASPQPCILALKDDVSAHGNVDVTLTGCSVRSNASISTDGNAANISTSAFYANGSISGRGMNGPKYENAGTILDPYADNTPVRNALKKLSPGSGEAFDSDKKNNTSPSPGTPYSTWDIKGEVNLAAGIYYVNGDIFLGAQASLSGTGVTVVASGVLKMGGGSKLTLSAATTASAANGAIPGVVFAGSSTATSSFRGNTNPSLTGVVYYPNGALDFGGTAQGGSSGCLEVIAKSVTLGGNPSLAANCSSYGTLAFRSTNSPAVALVQ